MTTESKYTITNDNFKSIYPNHHDILINDICNYNKDTKHKSLYYDYYAYFYNSMTKYLKRNKISSCKNAIYNNQFKTHLKYRFNPPTKSVGTFQNLTEKQQHIYLKHDYKQQKGRIEQDIINYRFNECVGLKKATDTILNNWLFDKDKAYLNKGDMKKYIIDNDICFNYQQEYLINVGLSNDDTFIGLIIRLFYNEIYLECYINEYDNTTQTFKDCIDDYIIKYIKDDTIYKFIEISTPKQTFDYLLYNLNFCKRMMRIKYIKKFSNIDKTALNDDIKAYYYILENKRHLLEHKRHLLNRSNVLNEFNNIHYTKQRQKNIYLSLHNHKVFKKRVLEKESEDFIYNVLFIAQNNIINTFKNKECSICYCNVDDEEQYFYKCNKCDAKICEECKKSCDDITFIHDYNEPDYNTNESVNISFKCKCSVCMTKNSVEKIKNLNYKHNHKFDLIRYLRANEDDVKDALTDAYYKYQENHFITYTESLYFFKYDFVRDYLRNGISEDAYICICEKEDTRMLLDVCYTEQGIKDLLQYLFYHYEYNENIDEDLRELGDDFYNDYLKEAFIEYDLDELINNCNNEDVLNELLEITTDIHDKYESGFFYSIYDDKNDIDINNIVNSAINAFDDCY